MTSPALDAVDWLLDKSVVLGYTKLGPALRRHWWPADPRAGALTGKHVLLTGATSGIGEQAAIGLARLGAVMHLLGRNADRLERVGAAVRDAVPGADVTLHECDLADLGSVREFAEGFTKRVTELYALLHNAGTMVEERRLSPDRHELNFATHVLGPFLLTDLLRESLARVQDSRIVVMSSGGMYGSTLRDDDPEFEHGRYAPVKAYARTKRMQVSMACEWARRLRPDGISVHSMHPGWADTPGVRTHLPAFRKYSKAVIRSAAGGADTLVWLTATPGRVLGTGGFWHDRKRRPTTYGPMAADDQERRERLWDYCARATGVDNASRR